MDSIDTSNLEFIQFLFSDPYGGIHAMEESVSNLEGHFKHGFGIDGSSIVGMNSVEASDLILIPERHTFSRFTLLGEELGVIWCHGVMSTEDGGLVRHPRDVRSVLSRVVEGVEADLGLHTEMFSELEFYILDAKTGSPIDEAGYLDVQPKDKSQRFRKDLGRFFEAARIPVKRIHHEVGPGQNEVELQLQHVRANCDDTMLGLYVAHILADARGMIINKEPLPMRGLPGNGLHQHILLRDLETRENAMVAEGGGLSDIAYMFIAGMLNRAREITAVFATSEQSYNRLSMGHETPTFATWDFSNRQALVRIPKTSPESSRVEFRGGDFSGSVHLMCATILSAGAEGIKKGLTCPDNVKENMGHLSIKDLTSRGIQSLPSTFGESIKILEDSEFIVDSIGSDLASLLLSNAKQKNTGRWFRKLF